MKQIGNDFIFSSIDPDFNEILAESMCHGNEWLAAAMERDIAASVRMQGPLGTLEWDYAKQKFGDTAQIYPRLARALTLLSFLETTGTVVTFGLSREDLAA